MKKFELLYHDEGSYSLKNEVVDYAGSNEVKLTGDKSWFGHYLRERNINAIALNEEQCGRYLIQFFNSTLRPGEKKRIFVKVRILD
jgi:hypothetical protein